MAGEADSDQIEVIVLVKAAPVLTRDLEETMCVAGARVDGDSGMGAASSSAVPRS